MAFPLNQCLMQALLSYSLRKDLECERTGRRVNILAKDHTGRREELQDISPDDDPVKAGVIEFDIFGKLAYKRIIHGCSPLYRTFRLNWKEFLKLKNCK